MSTNISEVEVAGSGTVPELKGFGESFIGTSADSLNFYESCDTSLFTPYM